jgi:DNA-binding XRE family transcriptional regulator
LLYGIPCPYAEKTGKDASGNARKCGADAIVVEVNMLAVVKKPPVEFTVRGEIPAKYLKLLEKDFGPALSVFEDEETMPVTEMDWYRETKEKETPGDTLRFYRTLHKMTQETLAAQIGVTKQKISNMEHNTKPISRKTAYQLSEVFRISPGRFI